MSTVTDEINTLTACPACGHPAHKHWPAKGGYHSDATQYLTNIYRYIADNGKEYESHYGFKPNQTPGGLPPRGCFHAIDENWHPQIPNGFRSCTGFNSWVFCDCPIDRETVLALIRQGKTFC
jgi:hypothetical protein